MGGGAPLVPVVGVSVHSHRCLQGVVCLQIVVCIAALTCHAAVTGEAQESGSDRRPLCLGECHSAEVQGENVGSDGHGLVSFDAFSLQGLVGDLIPLVPVVGVSLLGSKAALKAERLKICIIIHWPTLIEDLTLAVLDFIPEAGVEVH